MATDKNSFILYCDLIHTVEKMPIEKAGELFIHILKYVNDLNPETDDLIIQLTFEPIKLRLKKDLVAWEEVKKIKSEAGKKGMKSRWEKYNTDNKVITEHNTVINDITKITVSDSVSVPVNVPVIVKQKKEKLKKEFLPPTQNEVELYFKEKGYKQESAKRAFEFYNTGNWIDSHGNKVLNWKQKMIAVWFKDENKIQSAVEKYENSKEKSFAGMPPRPDQIK